MSFGPILISIGISLLFTGLSLLLSKKKPVESTAPTTSKFEFTQAEEGVVIVDILGTSRVVGNVLGYWNNRSVAVVQDSSAGGKGGSPSASSNVTGYKYYLTWAVGICKGPATTLYSIIQDNDTVVWRGELNYSVEGQQITLTKDGETIGTAVVYFGSTTQSANVTIQSYETAFQVSAYRGLCYIVFNDCYIGDYNRAPNYSFVVKKIPTIGAPITDAYGQIGQFEINPAIAIWYILNTMRGLSNTWLDSTAFNAAALTLYNEGFGIGIKMSEIKKTSDFLESILNTIDGVLKYGADGKIGLYLVRGSTPIASLPVYTDAMMIEPPSFQRRSWMDTSNTMKIDYTARSVAVIATWATGGGQVYPSGYVCMPVGTVPYFSFKSNIGKVLTQIKIDGVIVWSGSYSGEANDRTFWDANGVLKDSTLEAIFA